MNTKNLRQRISVLKDNKNLDSATLNEINSLEKELDNIESLSGIVENNKQSDIQKNWHNECPIKEPPAKKSRKHSAEEKEYKKMAKQFLAKEISKKDLDKYCTDPESGVRTMMKMMHVGEYIQDSKFEGLKIKDVRDLAFYYCSFLLSYVWWTQEVHKKYDVFPLYENLSKRLVDHGGTEEEIKFLQKLGNKEWNDAEYFQELIKECPFPLV